MKSLSPLFCALATASATALAAPQDYHIVARFNVGGDTAGWDYLRVDPSARRIYVSHEKRFEVLDADTGKKLGEIGPVSRAHGVALSPETGHGFASSGIDDLIVMFDLKTMEKLKEIKSTGSNPDSIEYDPASKRVYAGNHGSGEVTVIDPASGEVVGTIKVEGKLEGIAFDGRGQGFVNAEDKSAIQVFDTATMKFKASWPVAPGEGGTGLAIDPESHRIFSACANNKIAVLDSDSGKLITTAASGEDPDGMVFDPASKCLFSSNPDGTISVVHEDSPNTYSSLATITTAPGAKTIALDSKTGRIMVPTAKYGPKPPPVKGGAKPKAPVLPGTFEVIVVGTK